ncbi:MAG: DNA repair protein RadA [Planctomycetes bacterium]|nr:DNA repair protein RadA [Planctomycetota bacterium]
MAKPRKVFVCRECGSAQSRWLGKCPDCGQWDSLEESTFDPAQEKDPQKGLVAGWQELGDHTAADAGVASGAITIGEVDSATGPAVRLASGIAELDRVLGGGLVAGSAVLMGGEPGIGKSTLLLQAAFAWAAGGRKVLYVSSEESAQQVGLRAKRLSPGSAGDKNLFVLAETNLARIVEQARKVQPAAIIIDSIQMIYKSDLPASPGSITQLRRCCADLVYLAKMSGIAIVLVGHVTKDGQLAGPRLLEHLVDCVLSFEGDRYHSHRVVRAAKNRFGTTLEIGLFEMTGAGLREVPEGAGVPAAALEPRAGSVVCPVMTGTRCLLVELQALTATGFLGAAKRKSSGLDANRLAMLIAVLEQHAGLRLADRDIFASSVGGVKVSEPASDLALLLAIAGAHYRKAIGAGAAVIGEVGLGGEVRSAPQMEPRIREAARLGYKRLIVPRLHEAERRLVPGVTLAEVKDVSAAIEQLGG